MYFCKLWDYITICRFLHLEWSIFSKLLSLHSFAFSSTGEKVSFGSAFVKWVQMPHWSLYHEKNSTSGITLSASMKYLLEKKCSVGFFFFERMLNDIMNSLGQTFVCLRAYHTGFLLQEKSCFFPEKPNKLQINITVATIW